MKLDFCKYHGTGNDFILMDFSKNSLQLSGQQVAQLCDRHFGIGADGLILLKRSADYLFHMQYFNADGAEGTMCGNGGRCAVAFAASLGLLRQSVVFSAVDGVHQAEVVAKYQGAYLIKLQLNDTSLPKKLNDGFLIDTGSPHFVKFVDNNRKVDVFTEGRKIRHRDEFADEGINVNFVSPTADGIDVRTYERGVENETLSCGTGVTAAAICATLPEKDVETIVNVETRGGSLIVRYIMLDQKLTKIFLEGFAYFVFKGETNVE